MLAWGAAAAATPFPNLDRAVVLKTLGGVKLEPRHDPVDESTTGSELIAAAKSRKPPCGHVGVPQCLPYIPNVGADLLSFDTQFGGIDFSAAVTHGDGVPMQVCGVSSTLAFLHAAKTAGDTVLFTLTAPAKPFYKSTAPGNVSLTYFHQWNAEEIAINATGESRSFTHYLINMRDPFARLRSAFNFWPTAEIERCFPLPESGEGAFNAFAESLNSSSACGEWARWVMRSPEASGLTQVRELGILGADRMAACACDPPSAHASRSGGPHARCLAQT